MTQGLLLAAVWVVVSPTKMKNAGGLGWAEECIQSGENILCSKLIWNCGWECIFGSLPGKFKNADDSHSK